MNNRITVLFPVTDLAMDGAQRQLLELVRGLDKNRFRPVVLSLHPGGAMEREFKAIPGSRLISLERKGKYDFTCLFKVLGILRRLKVDVVQPFLTPATLFGLLPALLCRTSVKVVTERLGPRRNARLGYRLYLKVEDFLSRFADWAVANSQAGREYLIKRGIKPSRIRVVYNGIDFSRLSSDNEGVEQVRQRLHPPHGGKVVGMMARMFPAKRHDTFLQAAALISQAMPDTRFALVGDGPLRSYLENLSQELGLASKVTFFGEQRDVAPYLSAFDIAALTSEIEGCSNSLLEAMALGRPVVATNVGGNRELVDGETGFLVPPRKAEALAEAIIHLLRDPDAAQAMGQRAKERVATQFSLEKMVNEYQSLYEETLRQKGRRRKSSAAGQGAAREMLLLCTTAEVAPKARERISQLLAGPTDWEYLLNLASFHEITALLAYNLTANGFSDRVPQPYLDRLKKVYNQTLYRNVLLSAEIDKVLSRFSQQKISAIPLKGTALAEALYDHPGLRSIWDMDVLVRPRDIPRVRACLAEMGYEVAAPEQLGSHPFHGAPYFKRGTFPFILEPHWGLDDRRLTAFPDEEIWRRAQSLGLHGVPTPSLSPEDNLLFLAYHLTKHDSGLLKFLCDIAELLKKYEGSLDWDYIREKARSSEVEVAVYYSLKRAQELLGAPVPHFLLAAIKPGGLRWWLLNLLVSQQAFVSPVKGKRLRSETLTLAHGLMMSRPRQTLVVLSQHRGRGKRGVWLRTAMWIILSFDAALWRYYVGENRHNKRKSFDAQRGVEQ